MRSGHRPATSLLPPLPELAEKLGRDALESWRQVTDAVIEMHLAEAPSMVRVAAEMSSGPG